MFNLNKHDTIQDSNLLRSELDSFDISMKDGGFNITIGDENFEASSIPECISYIDNGIEELKKEIWENWHDLANVAEVITQNNSFNEGSIDNLLFLNNVKKSFLLSRIFTDLTHISKSLKSIFNIDVAKVHDNLIIKFNYTYLKVKLLHQLIMQELYRKNLLHAWSKRTKTAQISGPWANLDLPMQERIWEWSEDEEYFENRERAKKEQIRYNPETNQQGFYYVWQDLNRDPYLFADMKRDSPYKSRHLLTIP